MELHSTILTCHERKCIISHYRYKSLKSFCFETFKHLLYPNATTATSYGNTGECKSFKRRQLLFSLLCFTGKYECDPFFKFSCRTTFLQKLIGVWIIEKLYKTCIWTSTYSLRPPLYNGHFCCSNNNNNNNLLLCPWYKKCKDSKRK